VRRVGGDRNLPVDVRVLAATRRNLDREVQAGRFRDDLFFRLAVARVELPPLRNRDGDIPMLASHFWTRLGGGPQGLAYDVIRRFEDYGWPGNVRELYNAVARLIALGSLAGDHVPRGPVSSSSQTPADVIEEVISGDLPFVPARQRVIEEFERRYVSRMVDKFGGSVRQAAEASGIARRYFQLIRARASKEGG
jgi:DNA-binding NtrC family response regulator